jgi:hypothetical protein
MLLGLAGEMDAGCEAGLSVDVGEVGLDGSWRDEQSGRDVGVGEPVGDQSGDVELSGRE